MGICTCQSCLANQPWKIDWLKARKNMPAFKAYTRDDALRLCIGSPSDDELHRGNCSPKILQLLKTFAGPHGATLAKIKLIQLGQADVFWPRNGVCNG